MGADCGQLHGYTWMVTVFSYLISVDGQNQDQGQIAGGTERVGKRVSGLIWVPTHTAYIYFITWELGTQYCKRSSFYSKEAHILEENTSSDKYLGNYKRARKLL